MLGLHDIVGFIFSVEPLFRLFIIGDNIDLQVNISDRYRARHIRTLTWYHNGTELQSSNRITVLNNGRGINIRNAIHADVGSYRVETVSLNFGHPVCDSVWLPLLKNHAALAPVTFVLKLITVNANKSPTCKSIMDFISYVDNYA